MPLDLLPEHIGPFTARQVATAGCEILDSTGTVVAWATDQYWAAVIVQALNESFPSPDGDGKPIPNEIGVWGEALQRNLT